MLGRLMRLVLMGMAAYLAVAPATGLIALAAERWTKDVPKPLKGDWIEGANCRDKSARRLVFFDGGFRWFKGKEAHGTVRGEYAYEANAARILFRLRETSEDDGQPRYEISLFGEQMVRRTIKDGFTEIFGRCKN